VRPQEVRFIAGAAEPGGYPSPWAPEVAFAGRSNVGKSSLINAVAGSGRPARVSRTPGRTREVNFFTLGSSGALVDLPGYGYARVPARMRASWRPLVEGYLLSGRPLALILLLVDARHPPMESDASLLRFLRAEGLPFMVALTKADAVGGAGLATAVRQATAALGLAPPEPPPLPVSARTGDGIRALRARIHEALRR
jgi:GTP-binding protein